MRLKAIVFLLIIITFLAVCPPLFSYNYSIFNKNLYAADNSLSKKSPAYQYNDQSDIIKSILDNEKNITDLKKIIILLNHLDAVYSGLYDKIKSGEKIIIFFDPAHGKLDNGKWEGEISGRLSSRGLPEEYYSVQYSRKLYNLLKNNKFISVRSTDDYMSVIKNESSDYKNIHFSETIDHAMSEMAFIIISEHLNNISSLKKADGIINLPGIHITVDELGNRYLTYIEGAHKGFLTLYNKYDISGFSRKIANRTKDLLSARGVSMNSWEYGAVADDRFSYFVDFPVSVIFEVGFISNPEEEKLLVDPEYQEIIAESQYRALLEGLEEIFGIDISGFWVRQTEGDIDCTELIKLSRIAIYYLQNDNPVKAVNTITKIVNKYGKSRPQLISYFTDIKKTVVSAEEKYKICMKNLKKTKYGAAKRNIKSAIRYVENEPVYAALKERYIKFASKYFKLKYKKKSDNAVSKIQIPQNPRRSPLGKPVILAVSDSRNLEQAVIDALQPDQGSLHRLIKSLNNAGLWKKVLAKKYSKKRKRMIRYWRWARIKVDFTEGIYLIKLNNKLRITYAKKTSQVLLDPRKYQNQQYLKNSYFAVRTKEKSL